MIYLPYFRFFAIFLLIVVPPSDAGHCLCDYDFDYRGYGCSAENVTVVTRNEVLIIEGEHFPLDNDQSVKVVTIRKSRVNYIPSAIFLKFLNLDDLVLNQVSLLALNQNSLNNCGSLKSLELESNELQELRSGVFSQCSLLQKLRLASNKIAHINPKAFEGLNKLFYLDLQRNFMQTLPATALHVLPSLVTFLVGGPNFTDIHHKTFTRNPLGALHIQASPIKELHKDLLKGQPKLHRLTIYDTQLEKIHPGTFDGLVALTYLMIHVGRLTEIPAGIFTGLTALQSIDLNWQRIAKIDPDAFVDLINLRYFYIGENRLTTLDGRILRNNPKLTNIDISSNPLLSAIDRSIFATPAKELRWLDARWNLCVDKLFDNFDNFTTQVSPYFKRCFNKFDENQLTIL